MDRSEFDKFACEYQLLHRANIVASGEAPEYFAEYKIKDLRRLLRDRPVASNEGRFLDFGAGVGTSVPFFRKYFPTAILTCVDVSIDCAKIGLSNFAGQANFVIFDGIHLPFPESTFDCVLAACVFHHIPPEEHRRMFTEMRRVLKPGGHVFVYEHNPFNPLTVRAVRTCPFDENAILIRASELKSRIASVGFLDSHINYRVFFPRALRWLRPLEDYLGWLPLGAQYYVWGRR